MKKTNSKMKLMIMGIISTCIIVIGQISYGATAKVMETVVNLRAEADSSSKNLVQISKDTVVEIIEKEGDWYKVSYDGKTGYLREDLIEVSEDVEEQESEPEVEVEVESEIEEELELEPETEVEEEVELEEETEVQEPEDVEEIEKVTTTSNEGTITQSSKVRITPSINSLELTTIEVGTEITVVENLETWIYVDVDGIKGWIRNTNIAFEEISVQEEVEDITSEEVVEEDEIEESETETVVGEKQYINSTSVNLRKEPSSTGTIVKSIPMNTEVEAFEEEGEWTRVKTVSTNLEGYVATRLLSDEKQEIVEETTRSSTEIRTETVVEEVKETVSVSSSVSGSSVVETAKLYLGGSYVYGGTTPSGFDCSGFTQYVYAKHGITIGRTAANQSNYGTAVSKSDLQPGDLVIFGSPINHVGIYIGNGNMVHAANPSRGIVIDTINSGYYYTNYVGARRL